MYIVEQKKQKNCVFGEYKQCHLHTRTGQIANVQCMSVQYLADEYVKSLVFVDVFRLPMDGSTAPGTTDHHRQTTTTTLLLFSC